MTANSRACGKGDEDMSHKCKDCGAPNFESSGRADICIDCIELRGQLFPALDAGRITRGEFLELQRTIANSHGSGRGARAMREALGLVQPEI